MAGDSKEGGTAGGSVEEMTDTSQGWLNGLTEGLPKYESVVEAIAKGIETGELKPGARLPPQRFLARQFGVTVATVTKAIEHATRRGLIVTKTGSGTFVCRKTVEEPLEHDGFVDLSLNTLPTSVAGPILQHSFRAIATTGEPQQLFGHSPLEGALRNRRAGAAWFALRGLTFSPDQVLITQGAHEGILCTLLALASPGDAVLCERLNYVGLKRIAQLLQLRLIPVDVDHEGLNSTMLWRFLRDKSIKAVVCTPVTHNPTTASLSPPRRAELLRFAREAAIPIVEDDVYGMLAGAHAPPLASEWPEGVVIVSSLSKSVSPGIRVGYVAAPAGLVSRIRDAMSMLGWTEPSTQATIASQLIHSGDAFQSTLLHRMEASRRVAIAARSLGPRMASPSGAPSYHVWVDTGSTPPENAIAELARIGILVSASTQFLIGDGPVDHALRISLGSVASIDALKPALDAVARVLSRRSPPKSA
ncbi:aminotransferase class I/II-fold pyridoxal phosphate-dependent enzyme [Pandoraea fibrosis]|uniref:Aminotransferase class I/II-fold pyridoxal phosphate-dependent enzyme n=1 Tax=Pandoraea fibrosis TaxID=1891094 RepID=A0ABX6HWV0_9BURK|nr:PLP-dependent aminotransferase family protein [Pandoraea fibrosis]QHE91508.1 aminotransferase class I/II-fold pyridoxal phosphate-dependent enzyme [Pandoraea fibrosis]QHF14934.1 aminotransferase class I/II-fold pyridoxal phosphate-dependent enzyme [Pandoraea fibrosis]